MSQRDGPIQGFWHSVSTLSATQFTPLRPVQPFTLSISQHG